LVLAIVQHHLARARTTGTELWLLLRRKSCSKRAGAAGMRLYIAEERL